MPASLESLDLLLLNVAKPRKIHSDGIHFQGLRYIDTNLAAYIGETVIIRYDPRDIAEIRVFHQYTRSEEHTSEPSHVAISYAVFCLKKKKIRKKRTVT